MRRNRKRWIIAAGIAAATIVLLLTIAILTLQSQWFYNQIRTRMVTTVEKATGGRVEIGAFRFNWKQLRAEVDNFTLHGAEPANKPPLFHAASVAVGLKIISLLNRDVNIQYLDVAAPQIDLIVSPDGRTNIPQPKIKGSGKDPSETILKLAINRFNLWNGVFALDDRQKTPFTLQGQNLSLNLLYDAAAPHYQGYISMQPLEAQFPGMARTPLAFSASISLEKDHITIEAAHVTTSGVDVQLSGGLQSLISPVLDMKYVVHTTMPAMQRILRTKLMDRGDVLVAGNAHWDTESSDYSATGNLHAYNLAYRSGGLSLQSLRADGAVAANPKGIDVTALRFSGAANGIPLTGRVEKAALTRNNLDLHSIALAAIGGSFHGDGRLRDFDAFTVNGTFEGLDIKRAVAIVAPQPLPWDGLVSGTAKLEGSLNWIQDISVTTDATIVPAAGSPALHGQVAAAYDGRADTLDLGRSTISLPNSRADFSGTLGRTLTVHLETTDLGDFLPALGADAASLPVKLQKGSAVFDGTINGKIDAPQASGHLSVTNVSYNQDLIDSVAADVDASPDGVRLRNAAVTRGPMHAQFEATAALHDWKLESAGAITGSATIRNSKISDLMALVGQASQPVSGTAQITAQVSGTIGDPHAVADITLAQGAFNGEPFDRIAAHATYSGRTIELTGGQFNAGVKQVTLTASYLHDPAGFDTGRLQFRLASNVMPLQQIHTLQEQRPGAAGTLQIDANGTIDVVSPSAGKEGYRIEDFHATIAALGLKLTDQPLGDAHITANSQNGALHAHLDSNFANSTIQGNGQLQLTGDYPGSATINFSKLDFVKLHDWISPGTPASDFTGSAEGALHVDGSALKPETLKAELSIPKFQVSPVAQIGAAPPFTLANSGPIVLRLANSVVTVESARFTGRSTDLSLTGKLTLKGRSSLDLRVNGHIDLAMLHDINRDFIASGTINADGSVRGDLSSPQVTGRVQFQNAAFNIADLPNGISNATGVIVFSGDRASIQNLSAETGGGKVELSGFATYTDGQAVFRIHAAAREVRVRKPEGVSTVANADLNFTGSSAHSMVSGTITILRTAFNPDSDFSSLLTSSAQPVRTPAAQTGLLGGLNFDVQITTAPDIQVQSTLTQDVQIDANLHLRGSASNPALLGRVNITQGQLVFFGTKYTIDGGSVAFYNPVKIAPVLDIDLETKARGIDITLTVSGPVDHLTLIPTSDPPLQYSEIISLLATGRAPSSDPAMLSAQNTTPTAYQQSAPSSLLGQAIATPVSGRLQRFFGVSSLKIDPTIPGVDANPQARLTLEQQVTPNVTFTYITNVTTSNPQMVQVEWALSKMWSVVALREENGMTGMDFFFKKRF